MQQKSASPEALFLHLKRADLFFALRSGEKPFLRVLPPVMIGVLSMRFRGHKNIKYRM